MKMIIDEILNQHSILNKMTVDSFHPNVFLIYIPYEYMASFYW